MQTQREPQASTESFLLPPLKLEFQISQTVKDCCSIDVFVRSGNHCFLHRQIETYYDPCDEIDALVTSSLLQWTLWLAQFESLRRRQKPGQPPQQWLRVPDWPSPESLLGRSDHLGF